MICELFLNKAAIKKMHLPSEILEERPSKRMPADKLVLGGKSKRS